MFISYEEFSTEEYPTWVIAFCPDTNSFFATNQRGFFWETEGEFDSEEAAIDYFESHVCEFINIQNKIMGDMFAGYKPLFMDVFLENTKRSYPEIRL